MSSDFFGQYGKISKVVINKRPPPPSVAARHGAAALPSVGVYVTYARKEDAARAIAAVDGSIMGGRILR
jgi:RNA recognition motif-containing protein